VVRLRRFPHYPRDRGDLGRRHPPGLVRCRRRRRPGIAFFVSAWLSNLGWLRWVALLWWVGELGVFALRHRPEFLPLSAALMLLLLAGPGLLLSRRRNRA